MLNSDAKPDYIYPERLVMRFREKGYRPSGRREVSGLRDIDTAVANQIALSLNGLFVTTETAHNRRLSHFLQRPTKDQVLVGHFEDVRDMVRSIRQAKAGRKSQHGNPFANPDALPIINVTRTLDLSYGYTERQLDREDYGEITDSESGVVKYILSTLPVTLQYIVTIASAEKEALAVLANALAQHFYFLHDTGFDAVTSICGLDVSAECAFNNLKGFSVADVSLPVSEERLFAGQMSFDVIADSFVAYEVEAFSRRVQVGVQVMGEHRAFPDKDA